MSLCTDKLTADLVVWPRFALDKRGSTAGAASARSSRTSRTTANFFTQALCPSQTRGVHWLSFAEAEF